MNKPKYKLSSVKHRPLERRYRQNPQPSGEKDVLPPRLPHVPLPRHGATERATRGDTDSDSDLSDTERLAQPPSVSDPPLLHLREVIDPSDLQPLRAPSRSHGVSRDSYPDFLPPPFNSWSLRELAVYLNTDGKNVPRSRPVNQFERYLDRLLQLEWQQILTLHEENSKSTWLVRRRPNFSLSAPKCILQCQRAFPLTLLSSVHPPSCNRFSVSGCTFPHHTHPQTEKSGRSRRSSSETRAHHLNRLSDSSLDHLKRMQAIGNIRNPLTHCPPISALPAVDPLKRKNSGGRSRSCGDESKDDSRGIRPERRTARCLIESKSLDVSGSKKESVARRTSLKHKHVEYIFQEQEMT